MLRCWWCQTDLCVETFARDNTEEQLQEYFEETYDVESFVNWVGKSRFRNPIHCAHEERR